MKENRGTDGASGQVQVVERLPTVIRTRLTGRWDAALCDAFIATIDEWRGSRQGLHAFHDITGIHDYDVAARDRFTPWARKHAAVFATNHALVESRIIAWAIGIVAVVSGIKISSYHSRDAFDEAYARYAGAAR